MSDTPKFEVIDRRKMKAQEERDVEQAAASAAEPAPADPSAGPRLVVNEAAPEIAAPEKPGEPGEQNAEQGFDAALPPPPTADESREQKAAYDASSQRLEELIRAQNPAAGAPPPVNFENLVQQLYVTAMLQMGAAAQEGQRPRVDIMGARTTIDLIGVLAEKTRGNLSSSEDRVVQTVLFELRMAFLELTSMMTVQPVAPPPPPGKK